MDEPAASLHLVHLLTHQLASDETAGLAHVREASLRVLRSLRLVAGSEQESNSHIHETRERASNALHRWAYYDVMPGNGLILFLFSQMEPPTHCTCHLKNRKCSSHWPRARCGIIKAVRVHLLTELKAMVQCLS